MTNRRCGVIEVSADMVENYTENVSEMLSGIGFVPVRVEMRWDKSAFKMIGISRLFRALDHGERIPKYRVDVEKRNDNSVVIFKATEVKE